MDKELIEKIARIICPLDMKECQWCKEHEGCPDTWGDIKQQTDNIVKLILDAGYVQQWVKCPDLKCKEGITWVKNSDIDESRAGLWEEQSCPTCHGRGQVQQYAKLAADQSLPENPYYKPSEDDDSAICIGYYESQDTMTTPEDGTVWAKVEVEK